MKKITKNTILKQGQKQFYAVDIEGIIYWLDPHAKIKNEWYYLPKENKIAFNDDPIVLDGVTPKWTILIVAKGSHNLVDVPYINLDNYIDKLAKEYADLYYSENKKAELGFIAGYNQNPNKWTDADMQKAIELAKKQETFNFKPLGSKYTTEEILNQIKEISIIEVDQNFNIISYE